MALTGYQYLISCFFMETVSAVCVFGFLVFALEQIPAADEASADVCSIWHLDVDTLPEWILTSVHQVSVTSVNKDNVSTVL